MQKECASHQDSLLYFQSERILSDDESREMARWEDLTIGTTMEKVTE